MDRTILPEDSGNDEVALSFLDDSAVEDLPSTLTFSVGYIRELEELQRPYRPPANESPTSAEAIPPCYCEPYVRCRRMIILAILARHFMDAANGHHGWNEKHEQYLKTSGCIRSAQLRLEDWYKEKNPAYPKCDCVLYKQLTANWGEVVYFTRPTIHERDRRLVAAAMAISILRRGRDSFQGGLIAPKVALDFWPFAVYAGGKVV